MNPSLGAPDHRKWNAVEHHSPGLLNQFNNNNNNKQIRIIFVIRNVMNLFIFLFILFDDSQMN